MHTEPNFPPPGDFSDLLVSLNGLDKAGFREWVFLPSMLCGAETKWWGDLGKREIPHEGIDLCFFRDAHGAVRHLDAGMKIPVTFTGRAERVIRDFLGFSLFLSHEDYRSGENRLFTVYGHTELLPGISRGIMIRPGDSIGSIADARKTGASVRSHLHISLAWIPDSLPVEELTWDTLGNPEKVALLDPVKLLELPCSVVPSL